MLFLSPEGHSLEGDWDRLQLPPRMLVRNKLALKMYLLQPNTCGSLNSDLRFAPKDKVLICTLVHVQMRQGVSVEQREVVFVLSDCLSET